MWVTGGEIALAARVGSACEVELGCQQPLGLLAERPLSAVSSTGVGANRAKNPSVIWVGVEGLLHAMDDPPAIGIRMLLGIFSLPPLLKLFWAFQQAHLSRRFGHPTKALAYACFCNFGIFSCLLF